MTPADIERMAEEAGMMNDAGWWFSLDGAREDVSTEALTRFAALVRAQALVEAASVAYEMTGCNDIPDTIRAIPNSAG